MTAIQLPLPLYDDAVFAFTDRLAGMECARTREAIMLRRTFERMVYGDALVCGSLRVEYLRDMTAAYFKVFWLNRTICIVEADQAGRLLEIIERLSFFLLRWGWRNHEMRLAIGGARTPFSARKTGLK